MLAQNFESLRPYRLIALTNFHNRMAFVTVIDNHFFFFRRNRFVIEWCWSCSKIMKKGFLNGSLISSFLFAHLIHELLMGYPLLKFALASLLHDHYLILLQLKRQAHPFHKRQYNRHT